MKSEHATGGYAYLPGLRFATAGVASLPGYGIEHAQLAEPLPLAAGFEWMQRHLEDVGRPLEALCGIDLRMPTALAPADFKAFNEQYIRRLDALGLLRDERVPFARTNVAPRANASSHPMVVACSYTVEERQLDRPSVVISGVAELPADADCPAGVIRTGETSVDALREKLRWIVDDVETRLEALGTHWHAADFVNLYWTRLELFEVARQVFPEYGVGPLHGYRWHDADAPMIGLELEIDVRRYTSHIVVEI